MLHYSIEMLQSKVMFAIIIFQYYLFSNCISFPFQIGINEYSKTAKIYRSLGIDEPPKKPIGAFMRFCKDYMAKNPASGLSGAELAKLWGKGWKELSATQKKPYEDAFKKDQVTKSFRQIKIKSNEIKL